MGFIKKYDRSVAVIVTALITLLTVYLTIGRSFNEAVASTSCIYQIKADLQEQKAISNEWEKRLNRFEGKIDRLLERR